MNVKGFPVDAAFRTFIEAQLCLVDEALWTPKENSIFCRAFDPAHVALVEATLTTEPGLKDPLFVDLDDIRGALKLLDSAGLDGVFHIQDDRLVLDAGTYRHRLRKTNAANASHPKTLSIKPRAAATVSVATLRQAIRVAESLGLHIQLIADLEEGLRWSAKGSVRDASGQLADAVDFKKGSTGERTQYNVDYLDLMLQGLPADGAVEIAFDTDRPIRLAYEGGGVRVVYWLAPRINEGWP